MLSPTSPSLERHALTVRGVVQGVGFRPHVARVAAAYGVTGWCGNDDESVFIEAQATRGALGAFIAAVRADAPALAVVDDVEVRAVATIPDESGFRIVPSRRAEGARTLIPADAGLCDDCRRELHDPTDRRYRYPFITCTNCGPRLSIIRDLPYDRPLTTMSVFPMCDACRAEYDDPLDRRFHAQPISCWECGPTLRYVEDAEPDAAATGLDAIEAARELVRSGGILAVKGLGGFTLMCDARDEHAVSRLRERKHRPDKPFAVMAGSVSLAAQLIDLDPRAGRELAGPARPIVIAGQAAASDLAPSVAPGLDRVGVMLASAAVHELLLGDGDVWVATSGNVSGDPLFFDDDEARAGLAGIADAFVSNDRRIHVPVEDSVVLADPDRDELVPLRRSRGYAPLPVRLASGAGAVLAVGGELKSTFALTRDGMAFLSPHIGDMGSLACQRAFERSVAQLAALHRREPDLLVADRHPDYATTRWAERHAEARGIPLLQVQHHHAHALSLVAEHQAGGEPVVVATFDGTGFGDDGTSWGGEFLALDARPLRWERAAHLRPFRLPGGDSATRNPWKTAVAVLADWGIDDTGLPCLDAAPPAELAVVRSQLAAGIACPTTSSVGRLFDAVGSLLGVRHRVTYEAQAAMELEAAASACRHGGHGAAPDVTPETLVRELADRLRAGDAVACLARRFHDGIAMWTAQTLAHVAAARGARVVGLSGGTWQNLALRTAVRATLAALQVPVLVHERVPAGDGGLSLGQAWAGTLLLERGEDAHVSRDSGSHPATVG